MRTEATLPHVNPAWKKAIAAAAAFMAGTGMPTGTESDAADSATEAQWLAFKPTGKPPVLAGRHLYGHRYGWCVLGLHEASGPLADVLEDVLAHAGWHVLHATEPARALAVRMFCASLFADQSPEASTRTVRGLALAKSANEDFVNWADRHGLHMHMPRSPANVIGHIYTWQQEVAPGAMLLQLHQLAANAITAGATRLMVRGITTEGQAEWVKALDGAVIMARDRTQASKLSPQQEEQAQQAAFDMGVDYIFQPADSFNSRAHSTYGLLTELFGHQAQHPLKKLGAA